MTLARLPALPRRGFILPAVLMMIGLAVTLGLATSGRARLLRTDVVRLQSQLQARFLMDAAFEALQSDVGAHRAPTLRKFSMAGGEAGYLLSPVLTTPSGPRHEALAFARSGHSRLLVALTVVPDAPDLVDGPPIPGQVRLELPCDLSDLPVRWPDPTDSGQVAQFLIQVRAAARARLARGATP